jgi:hypothetical protein
VPAPPPAATCAEALDIPGLHLIPDFVSPGEEADLLAALAGMPWVALARRRVQHYGFAFDYTVRGGVCVGEWGVRVELGWGGVRVGGGRGWRRGSVLAGGCGEGKGGCEGL